MNILASRRHGMNWEIAVIAQLNVEDWVKEAKKRLDHDCTVKLKTKQESDGTPYGSSADFYYIQVVGPADTDARLVQTFENILNEDKIFYSSRRMRL